jgi:hypothetical protein
MEWMGIAIGLGPGLTDQAGRLIRREGRAAMAVAKVMATF